MLTSRSISVALGVMLLSSLLLVSSAFAGQPSAVTVRVVGLTGTTLLPQTSVTTTAAAIEPEAGHVCSGTSAGGALYDAVHGNWVVKYESGLGYGLDGIQGLNFSPFSSASPPDAYWSFWLNNAPATEGACGEELESGADVVFFAQCIELGTNCPTSKNAPQHFLTATAPAASSVQIGTAVAVTVGSLNTESGAKESLPSGVTVTAGSLSATPNAQGVAPLTFPSTGTYTVEASAPNSVPSDPLTICVHNGNDGTCGTTIPVSCAADSSGCEGGITKALPPPPPLPDVAHAGGVLNAHRYPRRSAPRLLSGTVKVRDGGTLREVRISLQRRFHGRCFDFSGTRERFVSTPKCRPSFFSAGSSESFSYLLPARLSRGNYTYEIEAVDASGLTTKLSPGVSRVVFSVK